MIRVLLALLFGFAAPPAQAQAVFELSGQVIARQGICIYVRGANGAMYAAINAESHFADVPNGQYIRLRAAIAPQPACPQAVTIVAIRMLAVGGINQYAQPAVTLTGRIFARNGACTYIRADNGAVFAALNAQSMFADVPSGPRFRFSGQAVPQQFCPNAVTMVNVRFLGWN